MKTAMKPAMKTSNKLFFAVLMSAIVGITLPAYADVTKVSLKKGTVSNQKNLSKSKCRTSKIKGRNRRVSRKSADCSPTPRKFSNPKIGGLRIDACVRGAGWSKSDARRCDSRRLKKIANEFCKSKGFNKSSKRSKVSHKGRHAVLTYKKDKPNHSFWKRTKGRSLVKNIVCK